VRLNTEQFVMKFATKAGKERYKRTRKADADIIEPAKKSAVQKYESLEVEKEGRVNFYILGAKRSKIVKRPDKRGNTEQLETEFELKSIIVSYLVKNKVGNFSLSKWIQTLDIANEKLLYAKYNGNLIKHFEIVMEKLKKLPKPLQYNHNEDDIELLEYFTSEEPKRIKSNLKSVFKKLVDDGIIEHKTAWYGQTVKDSQRRVTKDELKAINKLKSRILEEHGITGKDLYNRRKPEIKAFYEAYEKQLKDTFGLIYIYESHKCKLIASIEKLENLEIKYDADDISQLILTDKHKEKFYNRSIRLAENREKNINSGTDRIKCLKIMKQYVPIYKVLLEHFDMKPMPKVKSFEFEGVTFKLNGYKVNPLEQFQAIREGNFTKLNNDISKKVTQLCKEQKRMYKIQQEQIKREREEQQRLETEKLNTEWNKRLAEVEAFRKELELEKQAEAEKIMAIINGN
jgi:hypothetical protein